MISLLCQLLAAILSVALATPMWAFTYDPVGNRTQKTSTLPGYPGGLTNHNAPFASRMVLRDANDQLSTTSQDGGRFCDEISPRYMKMPVASDQNFTISPQPGKFNPANENDDVFVHSQDGDFARLSIFMDWDAVTINGLKRWKGAANYACN
jgi:hypothetical protein